MMPTAYAAERALLQTVMAGFPYAALPLRLDERAARVIPANRFFAWATTEAHNAGRCGAVAITHEVLHLCLLTTHHADDHGYARALDASEAFAELVDPVARIARRARFAAEGR